METGIFTDYLLPLSLFIIMLGMGMSLVINDFKQIIQFPKAVILGLIGQIIVLPALAFTMVLLLNVTPMIAVGVMLVAACPGGSSSNLISHLAKGDTALSISLTAISSLITVITVPLVVGFSMAYFLAADQTIELPVGKTVLTLIAITLLPVSLGMMIKAKYSDFASKQENKVNVFSGLFLAFLVFAILYQQPEVVVQGLLTTGSVVLTLNLVSMLSGFILAHLFKLNFKQKITISIEVGIQNGTLAILIATTILRQAEIAIPAAIYALIMFITGGIIATLSRHHQK